MRREHVWNRILAARMRAPYDGPTPMRPANFNIERAYENLLHRVQKPGRYLGNERGMVRKPIRPGLLRFALAFPDVYEIAQSHAGLQILYDLLNRRTDVYAERVYAPWLDMEAELRRAGLPLVTLETFTPLADVDIVGFTLQYELTYTNLLAMLELGGIPLKSSERTAQAPLVIAGGPCAHNPEPLAEFLDAFLLGDGEEAIHDICNVRLQWDGRNRSDLLEALAEIPGIYVPAFFEPRYDTAGRLTEIHPLKAGYTRVVKRILRDLNTVPIPQTFIVPTTGIVHDRPSVEVMRGCVKGCRFCQAGYVYRPLRERGPERVLEHAETALRQTGHDEISLLSLSTGDYSCVNPVLTDLMNRFSPQRVAVSLPSTRVDALAPSLLEQIRRVRKTGFTIAPEAGSQRLRDVIQKQYQEEELVEAAKEIFDLGWRSIKLYFMIGLPSETEDDLRGIIDLARKVSAAGNHKRQVIASVSNFIPKAHTPFQWAQQVSTAEIENRQNLLRGELARYRIRFRYHDARLSLLEGLLSRGDRRTGALLLRAYQSGCRFDGWNEECRFDLWEKAMADCGFDAESALRRRPLDEILPWDHLSCGVSKDYLQRELAYAFERTLTPDCSIERCRYCGVCDFKEIRNIDYHLAGAKAAEHRGERIAHWASEIVGGEDPTAWEPRGWHKVRDRQKDGGSPPGGLQSSKGENIVTSTARPLSDDRALGNAEEWLTADGEGVLAAPAMQTPRATARIRLKYRKVGLARFIGTLEMTTLFYRAVRRARVPIAFSQGYHPLPRFAFSPALPLGTESESEIVDLHLTERWEASFLAETLNHELPAGLKITDAREIPLDGPSSTSEIQGFRYRVDVSSAGIPGAELARRIHEFHNAREFPLQKHSKGAARIVDARSFVIDIRVTGESELDVTLLFGPQGTLKPAQLLGAILHLGPEQTNELQVRKLDTLFRQTQERTLPGTFALPV